MQSKDVLKTKSQEEKNHHVFLSHFSLSVLLKPEQDMTLGTLISSFWLLT